MTGIERQVAGLRQTIRYAYDVEERLIAWQETETASGASGGAEASPVLRHQARYAHDAAGNPVDPLDAKDQKDSPDAGEDDGWEAQVRARWREPGFNVLGETRQANRVTRCNGVSLAYDGRGNVIRRESANGFSVYAWNALNQLIACVTVPAG